MKQNALQGLVPNETEDLNVEHVQLLLLLFHNFTEKGRRAILTLFVQIIQELGANMDAQLRSVPLILARLLLIFDYLLHQYSKAPVYLFEQVRMDTLFLLDWFSSRTIFSCSYHGPNPTDLLPLGLRCSLWSVYESPQDDRRDLRVCAYDLCLARSANCRLRDLMRVLKWN